jgi:YggT family protein
MSIVGQVVTVVLWLFLLLLIFRIVMEYVFQFARSYRPRGVMLVAVESTYTATDPPLRLLRRYLRPLRIGGVALDLSFMILLVIVYLLIQFAGRL